MQAHELNLCVGAPGGGGGGGWWGGSWELGYDRSRPIPACQHQHSRQQYFWTWSSSRCHTGTLCLKQDETIVLHSEPDVIQMM